MPISTPYATSRAAPLLSELGALIVAVMVIGITLAFPAILFSRMTRFRNA